MNKKCARCNRLKPISEFYTRGKGGRLYGQCHTCIAIKNLIKKTGKRYFYGITQEEVKILQSL